MRKIDIYCDDNKCPICNSELIKHEDVHNVSCKNNCYIMFQDYNGSAYFTVFKIFKERVYIDHAGSSKTEKLMKERQVRSKIRYWRKDYRYLAEILENS